MAQKKFTELPAATTPLAGTEIIAIVQGGVSKQTTVDDLPAGAGGGTVDSIVAGTGITVDATDPANPIVAATGGGGTVESVTGDGVDNSDPDNPVLTFPTPVEIGAATTGDLATVTASVLANKWKQSVRVATTTNGTLATAFENGDTIDGIVLATGDRILIKNQTTSTENGIYVVAASGAPTRATDADAGSELEGAAVMVQEGTSQRNTIFVQISDSVTIGVTGIVFIRQQPFVTPEQFGAVGDGSTDDSTAFTAAFASGFAVHGDKSKNYRFATAVTLPDNSMFIGNGCTLSVASLIHTFILGNNCEVHNTRFDGTTAGSTGINVSSVFRNRVSNCYFQRYAAAGMFITQTAGASDYEGGVQVSNCYFENCSGRGVRCFTNAEYNNFTNCTARGNTIANVTFGGGNNTWTGGKITDSAAIGFELVAGTNDGHGTIVGTSINHNATNVSAISVANGFEIIACDIIAGNITITTSNAINIRSSRIDGTVTATLTNNTNCNWTDNHFVASPTFSITGTGDRFFNNEFENAIPSSVVNRLFGKAQFSSTAETAMNFTGTLATTTATQKENVLFDHTTTTRATVSDIFGSVHIKPTITAGTTGQTLYGLWIEGTNISNTNTPTKYTLNVDGGMRISMGSGTVDTFPLLVNRGTSNGPIFKVQSNTTDMFVVSDGSGSTANTITGVGTLQGALSIAGTFVPTSGVSSAVTMSHTHTATGNGNTLRGFRLFPTYGANTRTGTIAIGYFYDPIYTVSTGSFAQRSGFVFSNTTSGIIHTNGIGVDAPTAQLHIGASTTAAGTAAIKIASGTLMTTAETGGIEYDGTNLFFTRTGTTRESVICSNSVNSVSPTAPDRTITVVIAGTTYYLHAKTTND